MQAFFRTTIVISFHVLILLNLGLAVRKLNYEYLEFLGASCYPWDTCDQNNDFDNRTCECDPNCDIYGECCISNAQRNLKRQEFECFRDETTFKHVYVISKCQRNYVISNEVREKCEDAQDMSDPWPAAPSTDIVSNITYKNRYCAECNNANLENLRSWEIKVKCNDSVIDSDYIRNHMAYVTSGIDANTWGFHYNEEFHPCELEFRLPNELEDHVRFCKPFVISSCDETHGFKRNVELCKAYTALIQIDYVVYKNPHCARCNNEILVNFMCGTTIREGIIDRGKKPALSFTVFADVNTNTGSRVGEVSRCGPGEEWDVFVNRCRKLVCAIPGHIKRNNKCGPP